MTMTDETTPLPPEDEISLLDLLLVVAENARLLIFGPLLASQLGALGGLAGAAGLNVKNPAHWRGRSMAPMRGVQVR